MDKLTYISNISSILQQPSLFPTTVTIFTQTTPVTRSACLSRAQLEAITHMQKQFEPLLRMQKRLTDVNTSADALVAWVKSMQLAADPLQEVRSALQAMSNEQARIFVSSVYSPQMAAAIRPALVYLEQVHPNVYREIVTKPQPSPAPSTPPRRKKRPRRRVLAQAARLTSRADDILKSLDDRIQSMPSSKVSNILSLLLGASSIAPPEYAHSISLLCFAIAVFLTFQYKEERHQHDGKPN